MAKARVKKTTKMSKKQKSLVVGIICGLLCALCVGIYVTEVDKEADAAQSELLSQYGGEQIDVCVAKHDIVTGETISESDIEMRTWIATLLPENAIRNKNEALGKQVGSTILAGEVISANRFGFDAAALDVPDGMVAVSVPSREVQAVGGAISAGMMVDIYAVGASSTARLASSVQVLSTSLESGQSGSDTNAWVTLAVVPQKVQELVGAAENLDIYFAVPSESALEDASEVEVS